jgi:WD40 repeat protein
VWDSFTGNELVILGRDEIGIGSAEFSPDGRQIVTTSGPMRRLRKILSAVAQNGESKEFDSGDAARVWDSKSGKLLVILRGHTESVSSACFSPDGKSVLTASFDKTAKIWEASSGKKIGTLNGHEGYVRHAQFSGDAQRVLTTSYDKTARIWDSSSGKLLSTLKGHDHAVLAASFSPDGCRIATSSDFSISGDATVKIWETDGGSLLTTLHGHTGKVLTLQFSLDSSGLVTASIDGTARIWDITKTPFSFKGHRGAVEVVEFSSNGEELLMGSGDKIVRRRSAISGKLRTILQGDTWPIGVHFTRDGNNIISAWRDGSVWNLNLARGEHSTLLQGKGDYNEWVGISPDGTRIVTDGKDNTAEVWDLVSGRWCSTLKGHYNNVNSASFSLDGKSIVTASTDNSARMWKDGKQVAIFQGHARDVECAKFSPDGQRVVTGSDDHTARVWNSADGNMICILRGHEDTVKSVHFSPCGQRVVTGGSDGTVRVWDSLSGTPIAKLREHSQSVNCAQFSPDGLFIVSASGDQTARLWIGTTIDRAVPNWFPQFLKLLACRQINRNGEFEDIVASEWLRIRAEIQPKAFADTTRYGDIARWHFFPANERPIRPGDETTRREAAEALIVAGTDIHEVSRGYQMNPGHPLIPLALAKFEQNPSRAVFLARLTLKRLGEVDAKLYGEDVLAVYVAKAAEWMDELKLHEEAMKARAMR